MWNINLIKHQYMYCEFQLQSTWNHNDHEVYVIRSTPCVQRTHTHMLYCARTCTHVRAAPPHPTDTRMQRAHPYTCACTPPPHTHTFLPIHMCVPLPTHTRVHIQIHKHTRTNTHTRMNTHTHKIRVSVHGLPGADAEPAQWKIPPSRCLIKCCDNGTVCLFLQRSVGKITMHYNS